MLWYIIDGWNLLKNIEEIKDKDYKALVDYIKRYNLTGSRNNKVTIVFDGKFAFLKDSYFDIICSGKKTADEVIENLVERTKNRKQIVVISNDLELVHRIRLLGANYKKVKDFLSRKKKRERKKKESDKNISYSLQREITEELKNIWLKKY